MALVDALAACIICDDDLEISKFLDLVAAVKEIRSIPVFFLIDQFNILRSIGNAGNHEPKAENDQARISYFFLAGTKGCVISATTAPLFRLIIG